MTARAGHVSFLRNPRTFQEIREGAARAKRNNIPTAWDDISRRPQRCWKEQRRSKWRRA